MHIANPFDIVEWWVYLGMVGILFLMVGILWNGG